MVNCYGDRLNEEMIVNALRTFPSDKAFYFFNSIGNYAGLNAVSLKELMEKINLVNVKSLEFHQQRGDLEKWIKEVLGDAELANGIRNLNRLNLTGEDLRRQLHATVSSRFRSLNSQLRPTWKSSTQVDTLRMRDIKK